MKKALLFFFFFPGFMWSSYGQFYIRAGFGYAIPQAGETSAGNGWYAGSSSVSSNSNFTIKQASFSAGVQSLIGAGYLVNRHLGIQLDGDIGIASKKFSYNYDETSALNLTSINPIVVVYNHISRQSKNLVMLTPSVILQTGGDVLNIYSRFGVVLPVNTKIEWEEHIAGTNGASGTQDYYFLVKNGFSPGYMAALGIEYKLNRQVRLWMEFSSLSMSLYIKEADLQNYLENGGPPANYPAYTTITFSKAGSFNNKGTVQPAYLQPYSNIGFYAGISYRLSGKNAMPSEKSQ